MWRETADRNRRIFDEELDDFLPERILDFHVHLLNPGIIPDDGTFCCAGHPIPAYTIEDLGRDLAMVYPKRQISSVCFGFPDVTYDRDSNNRYVAEVCDGRRYFAFRLLDVQESPQAVRNDLLQGRFVGLKPYPDYVRKPDLTQVEIREMLPPWAMEIADELRLPIVLHIPRAQRMADPFNQQQIVEWCTRYPGARLILAHVGRAYWLSNIIGNLDRLKDLPNLYFDLAMVNQWEVMEYLFSTVAAEKILYGTDIPIALAPGKSVEINNQYTYITPVPWKLSISDDHRKIVFTSFLYEELRAIRKAVQRLGLGRQFVREIFHDNGMRLLNVRSR